jgi:hypothetical protein
MIRVLAERTRPHPCLLRLVEFAGRKRARHLDDNDCSVDYHMHHRNTHKPVVNNHRTSQNSWSAKPKKKSLNCVPIKIIISPPIL